MDLVPQTMPGQQAVMECKAGVGVQRDKDGDPQGQDVELQDGDLSAEEREFLEQFSRWKQDQEVIIKEIYALAEDVDETHKRVTKAKVMTKSASVMSSVMALLGLALAPATMGASLMLTAVGQGLGAVAGVTGIVTNMLENSCNKKARAQASSLVPHREQELEKEEGGVTSYVQNTSKIVYDCGSAVDIIGKHTRAMRLARAHPHLANSAKRLMTTGQVSTRTIRKVQKAFGGTPLAMTKEARMFGGAATALFLGQDLVALSKDWKQLKDGRRAELAEELRAHARELEEIVWECTQCYNRLRQKKLLQEKKRMGWLRRWLSG